MDVDDRQYGLIFQHLPRSSKGVMFIPLPASTELTKMISLPWSQTGLADDASPHVYTDKTVIVDKN